MFNTIGILGAMPEEIAHLCSQLTDVATEEIGGCTFYKGNLHQKKIVLVCAGMGKVNAAAATQLLITYFGAQSIIFSGIAGNMTSKINVGDVVISETVVYHDAQTGMIAQAYPNLEEYTANEELKLAAEKACKEANTNYIVGKIATGDKFVGDTETKNSIKTLCAPDCVEMEGAAVAHVAAKNDVPFVILRSMSDNCDEEGYEKLVENEFDISEYCETAAKICYKIIETI